MLNHTGQRCEFFRRFIGLAIALWLATLTGCAVPTKAVTGATPETGHGIVLVRVSSVGLKNMYSFLAIARPIGAREQIYFSSWGMQSEGYWTVVGDHLEKGQLVALQIPAGDYEFFPSRRVPPPWRESRRRRR